MTGPKTNERPGTKATLRHFHMSASKARLVLDLIRGQDVDRAAEILNGTEREAARVIAKILASAVANAVHNDGQVAEDLFVSAAYADEGPTMKRWRPRARGRASRIRKRTCHITVIVARMEDDRLERRLVAHQAQGAQRARRVSESQRRADQQSRGRRRDAVREAELEAAAAEGEELIEAPESVDAEATTDEAVEAVTEDQVAEPVADDEVVEVEADDEVVAEADEESDAAPEAATTEKKGE